MPGDGQVMHTFSASFLRATSLQADSQCPSSINAHLGARLVHISFTQRFTKHSEIMYQPNLVAMLIAGLIPMVVGSIWYGPLFGEMWMNLVGRTEEEFRASIRPIKMYVVTFIMSLILAFVLAHILEAFTDAYALTGLFAGVQVAFWMWLGFVLTIGYQAVAFEDKKLRLFGLNMAYNLVSLVAMGALLGVWR